MTNMFFQVTVTIVNEEQARHGLDSSVGTDDSCGEVLNNSKVHDR